MDMDIFEIAAKDAALEQVLSIAEKCLISTRKKFQVEMSVTIEGVGTQPKEGLVDSRSALY